MAAPLPPGHIHLWSLSGGRNEIEELRSAGLRTLSPDEQRRFDGMKHRRAADRFVFGRIMLRGVLARYLDRDPADIAFGHTVNGKPFLADPPARDISFNLSDSGSAIILAVSGAPAIGVDLESKDRANTALRIAREFFAPGEIRDLESLGPEAAARALTLWTLKESVVKAQGATVWDGLARIPIAFDGKRIIWSPCENPGSVRWHLAAGPFGKNHVLALAVRLSGNQAGAPPVYRTYRMVPDEQKPDSFEPVFST